MADYNLPRQMIIRMIINGLYLRVQILIVRPYLYGVCLPSGNVNPVHATVYNRASKILIIACTLCDCNRRVRY
jgi:hypothetical protein